MSEHNLDVIKSADHLIDIGPEGGDADGKIVATGTPEQVAKVKASYTGEFLKGILGKEWGDLQLSVFSIKYTIPIHFFMLTSNSSYACQGSGSTAI